MIRSNRKSRCDPIYIENRSRIVLSDIGKGTYLLILYLKQNRKIMVGRRKDSTRILFRAGYYAYVGSAYGPGGLASRINRHLIRDKKSVWHIDFLRKEAVPVEVWVSGQKNRPEKSWADALFVMKGSQPIEKFGNTDDRKSRTHLCYFEKRPSIRVFSRLVRRENPSHAPIQKIQLVPIQE